MRSTLLALAGAGTLAFALPAHAAPGQCFDAAAQAIGPVYDTETPDTGFINWVQARGGECRALRADEVTLNGQRRGSSREYRSQLDSPPSDIAPGAPRSTDSATWNGDPLLARRLLLAYYQPQRGSIAVVDTGRLVRLSSGGSWRLYDVIDANGAHRSVAVRMEPNRRYLLVEQDGNAWSNIVYLNE
ncbi:MAG: hypothetical protein KIT16_07390 [Rhodospirillaceae bacterium]|nr:hypothetical protein [Rhodospirillaceae bacterium]